MKYTIERSILEFTQPKPNASLNHAHSIPKAIFGKKMQTTPIQAEAIWRDRMSNISPVITSPVTITSIVLEASFFCIQLACLK
ncbi:MAG TPA: hypothetical protein PLM56_08745 [Cyclobacteriaceae bacterium]|nr:hypothetical protein [Cytophagales bacterium]HRE68769.1 hypothetical protein [Cyclobacteriaceae bacterium]HRF33575.1 hypothetical protein [Cyclobacteriaceae bacterium]